MEKDKKDDELRKAVREYWIALSGTEVVSQFENFFFEWVVDSITEMLIEFAEAPSQKRKSVLKAHSKKIEKMIRQYFKDLHRGKKW